MAADKVEHSTSAGPQSSGPGSELGLPDPVEAVTGEAPAQADPGPETAHSESAPTEPKLAQGGKSAESRAAPRPRSPWLALAASIVTGALIAVGGAFGLHWLEASKTTSGGDAAGRRIEALSLRADALDQKISEAAEASREAAVLKTALAALDARVSAVAAATKSALGELESAVAAHPAAEGSSPEAGSALDLAPVEARLAALEQKLQSVEAELTAPKADVRALQARDADVAPAPGAGHGVAIVAESLLDKIQRGAPFASDVSALENLGVGADALAPLKAHATTGVATARSLAIQFAPLASPILAAEPAKERQSFLDEITRTASKLVHVHRDDAAPGDDVPGLVDGIEAALAHHDVEDALALWTKLPDPAKARSEAWGEAARARTDALSAARAIKSDAVTLVAKPKS